jgi:hypothetical protein
VPSVGEVQIYDPATNAFVSHPNSNQEEPVVFLEGPFVYFLSTVNVDRLEPTYRITPLARTIPPTKTSCELVILRPLRDPTILQDNPLARESFVSKLWTILGSAYQGQHICLRYNDSGDIVSGGEGTVVVEYIRCGGWEWIPVRR